MQHTHTAVKCISYCRWQTPSTGKKSKVSNRVWVLAPLYSVINLYVGELCKMSLGEISGWAFFFFFALTFLKMHLLSLLYPISLISPENTVRHSWSCGPPQTVGTFSLGCCPGSTAWHEEEGSKNLETWTDGGDLGEAAGSLQAALSLLKSKAWPRWSLSSHPALSASQSTSNA